MSDSEKNQQVQVPPAMQVYEDPKEVRKQIRAEKKQLRKEQKQRAKEMKERERDLADRESDLDVSGGGVASFLLTILIIAMWLGIMGLLIRLDVGGFGSTVLAPILKDVPYLNMILPESAQVASKKKAGKKGSKGNQSAYIQSLEEQLKEAQQQNKQDQDKLSKLQGEVDRLKVFEDNQTQFEQDRNQFYQDIIYNNNAPDPSAYEKYYKMIAPDAAAKIYEEVTKKEAEDADVLSYAKVYSGMKPKAAAAIFDEMVQRGTEYDVQLVARILLKMSSEDRGNILAKMSASNAAVITDIMEPNELGYPDTALDGSAGGN